VADENETTDMTGGTDGNGSGSGEGGSVPSPPGNGGLQTDAAPHSPDVTKLPGWATMDTWQKSTMKTLMDKQPSLGIYSTVGQTTEGSNQDGNTGQGQGETGLGSSSVRGAISFPTMASSITNDSPGTATDPLGMGLSGTLPPNVVKPVNEFVDGFTALPSDDSFKDKPVWTMLGRAVGEHVPGWDDKG